MPHAERNQIGVDLGDFKDLDDIPEDLAELEAALVGDTPEETSEEASETEETAETSETDATEETDQAESSEDDDKPEETTDESDESEKDEEKVILANDGKSTIPYSVLKAARAQAAELKQELEAERARLTELEQRLEKPEDQTTSDQPATEQPKTSVQEGSVEEKFQQLYGKSVSEFADEFGNEMKDVMVRQVTANLEMEQRLAEIAQKQQQLESTEEERAADEAAAIREEVQAAIDKVPVLAEWQAAEDQTMWNAAIAVDQTLRENPEWAHASFEDRFKEVARRLGGVSQTQASEKADETPALSKEEMKAKADKAVKDASETVPTSLSEAPGAGAQTPQNEVQKIEHLTPTQLEGMFEKMTPEQQEAYLANL